MAGQYRYADKILDVISVSSSWGRNLAEYQPALGDGAQLADRGKAVLRYTLTIRVSGDEESSAAEMRAYRDLSDSGETRVFVDPDLGIEMDCKLADLNLSQAPGNRTVTMTLVEHTPMVFRDDLGELSPMDLRVAAADFDAARQALTVEIPDSSASMARIDAWTETTPARSIRTDAEAIDGELRASLDTLAAMPGPEAFSARMKLYAFARAVQQTAAVMAQAEQAMIAATVPRAMGLSTYLAGFYGADARRMLPAVLAVNSIDRPLRLPAGTALLLPRP